MKLRIHAEQKMLFFALLLGGLSLVSVATGEEKPSESQALEASPAAPSDLMGLSERALLGMLGETSPNLARVKSALAGAEAALAQTNEPFNATLYSSGSYAVTNEQPLISFAPIFSPIRSAAIGIRKKSPYGLSSDLSTGFVQQTAESVNLDNATTLQGSLKVTFDLWKDLFGRTSRARIRNAEAAREKALLQERIQTHVLKMAIRKLYWQWVAYEESEKLNLALLESAKKQAKTARRRLANSISDKGEVARYESQVAAREASLTFQRYQRDSLKRQIKDILPGLEGKEFSIGPYNIEETVQVIHQCTERLVNLEKVPMENTLFDEMLEWTAKSQKSSDDSLKRYSDPNIQLLTEVRTTGVDSTNPGTLSDAFQDTRDQNRWGYTVGLEVSVPLGSSTDSAERFLRQQNRLTMEAEQTELRGQIINTHHLFVKSMRYLNSVIASQKENSAKLAVRVKEMRRKFSQARISVTEYINDQDAQFNADLTVLDTQVQAVSVLLDYFSVFTETQCEFNKI